MKNLIIIIAGIILFYCYAGAAIGETQLTERVRVLKSIVYLLEEVEVKHTPMVRIEKGE